MPQLICKIQNKIAKPLNDLLICDNSDFTIRFKFDDEWNKETVKTARFIWNKQYVDVVFTGDTCAVPVITNSNYLAVGVYAGELRTSTPAIFACRKSILSGFEEPAPPSEDVYNQIINLINEGISVDITNQVNELKAWVYTQTQTQRRTIALEGDNAALQYEYLLENNKEYYFTGGTVSSFQFLTMTEKSGEISEDYWALFVFPKAESVSTVRDLVLNSSIKLLNPDLDLSGYTIVHLLFTYDGQNICAIAAGY